MCGLLADFDPAGVDADSLTRGLASLRHRGPDGMGTWVSADRQVGLGHTRLATLDPTGSPQPIVSEDGLSALIVNGEFYDHQTIRAHLSARGHRFKTAGDSEIALHLYEDHGLGFLKVLRGEFALVLWDGRARRLIAARDRWGIKPLCYHQAGRRLRMASEAKALFGLGVAPAWDEDSLFAISGMQYAPGNRTLFDGVRQLPPGHFLVADGAGVREGCYWDLDYPRAASRVEIRADAVDALRDMLGEAVRIRLRADVPVCFHLSGGLDSAAVVALAARERSPAPACFTVGFDSVGYDERVQAEQTAVALGVELQLVEATRQSMLDDFSDAVWFSEGLAINGHLPAKFALARAIRAAGYRVVLSGEGSDEIFGGYARLRHDHATAGGEGAATLARLRQAAAIVAGIHLPVGDSLSVRAVERRFGFVPSFLRAKASLGWRMQSVLRDDFRQRFADADPLDRFGATFDAPRQLAGRHVVDQSAYLWSKSALATYILRTLGDGTEMAHGVEGRLPMLDHPLFEFVRGLPPSMKIDAGNGKVILREAMRGLLPDGVCDREKQPFTAPPLSLTTAGRPEVRILDQFHARSFADQPMFDPKKVIAQVERMPRLDDQARVAMDPVLMLAFTAALAQERFGLGQG